MFCKLKLIQLCAVFFTDLPTEQHGCTQDTSSISHTSTACVRYVYHISYHSTSYMSNELYQLHGY